MIAARFGVILVVTLALGGCAAPDPSGPFTDIANTASERLGGSEVRWARNGKDETAAQEAIARLLEAPLSEASAVRIALLNNQRLQAEYEEIGIAHADLVQAGLLENPSVSVDILAGNGAVSPAFSIVENVFGLLTMPARRTMASSTLDRTKYAVGAKILNTAAEVRSAYYKLVGDQQAADLFHQVVSATEAAADLAGRQVTAGNLNRRDQALQQAQYAESLVELARIEAQLAVDREGLNRLLGLYGEQIAWNLPDRLPDVAGAKPELEGLETLAIEHRLDLAGARADVQTATYALELGQQLRWLTALGLGVTIERDPGGSGAWLKGPKVEFSLPIFDLGTARITSLEAQQRKTGKLFVGLAVDVRSEVREAYLRLAAAQDAATFYRTKVLPLKQQIVAENQRLYNGMLVGVYDLLRSRQDQINSARDYIGTLKDYWIARSQMERALAGPLPIASADPPPKSP